MNKENAAQYLPLVQALAEGKVIQQLEQEHWIDVDTPIFSAPSSFYRIRPEHFECWVNVYSEDRLAAYLTSGRAFDDQHWDGFVRTIRMIEAPEQ